MRGVLALSAAAAVQAASFGIETVHDGAAPILSSVDAEAIPDSYIIKFKEHVDEAKASDHHSWIQNIHSDGEQARLELRKRGELSDLVEAFSGMKHTFSIGDAFKGYAGHFHESVIEQLRTHPDVSYPCAAGMLQMRQFQNPEASNTIPLSYRI
jgi:cerevisin